MRFITNDELIGSAPDKWILVETQKFSLSYCEGRDVKCTYTIGIGRSNNPTPTGNYYIYSMSENPKEVMRESDMIAPVEAYGTRMMDLSLMAFDFDAWCWRHYAIHGTDDDDKIGTRCSRGCITMKNSDIEGLYPLVSLYMLVIII